MNRKLVTLAALLALAACGDDTQEPVATGGEAAGEVLGGTISDDMLPLEELTSTSPPAAREPGDEGSDSSSTGTQEAEAPPSAPAPETATPDDAGSTGEE